jgi:hypothetical protein
MRLFTRERNEIDPSSAIFFFFFTRRNVHTHITLEAVCWARIDVPAAALIFLPFYFILKKTARLNEDDYTHTPPFNISIRIGRAHISAGLCATGAMIALDIFVTCLKGGIFFSFIREMCHHTQK